jgi:hypothetical protein
MVKRNKIVGFGVLGRLHLYLHERNQVLNYWIVPSEYFWFLERSNDSKEPAQ